MKFFHRVLGSICLVPVVGCGVASKAMTRLWHLLTLAIMLVALLCPFMRVVKLGTMAALDLPSCDTAGVGPDQACVLSSPVTHVQP